MLGLWNNICAGTLFRRPSGEIKEVVKTNQPQVCQDRIDSKVLSKANEPEKHIGKYFNML